ncbi:MAG TPA: ABC transporter ATP-binding protein [Hyphomicrobiaceae bacterium]|jgi:putative spermidine/putrescine transport system ATP-binding protein
MVRGASLPITIRKLTKSYGEVHALDNVDLDIESGEFLTLLGPSGSGKTTLLMVLAGFTRPDYGSVCFGDREVIRLAPHKRDVGMVFQSYALFPHMDVRANIAFPLKLRGLPRREIADRVDAALEMVQLGGYGERRIDQLSGGQRQRVALARAIVFEPRIVLMDEPLSALDKQLREAMQIELRQLHEKLGTTTIYVTHDQREALTMSDRIAVINQGKVVQLDTPRRVYDRPTSRFVAEFIGESTFLEVECVEGTCRLAGQPLKVEDTPPSSGRLLLMLRPERLQILDSQSDSADNVFEGRVTTVVYQGDTFLLQVVLDNGARLTVRGIASSRSMARAPQAGDPVRLGLGAEDAVLLPDQPRT